MKARNKKDIYLLHASSELQRLDESLKQVTNHKKGKHIILAGDFDYCPYIIWEKMSVTIGATDREVQLALLDLTYLSLVRSTLEYSSIVWDPYLQKDIDKKEKVH